MPEEYRNTCANHVLTNIQPLNSLHKGSEDFECVYSRGSFTRIGRIFTRITISVTGHSEMTLAEGLFPKKKGGGKQRW